MTAIKDWEIELEKMGLPEVPLQEATLISLSPQAEQDHHRTLKQVRGKFLKFLNYGTQNTQDLFQLGLKRTDFDKIRQGIIPENYTIHLQIPFAYGGEAVFENMIFMSSHFHLLLRQFTDKQIDGFSAHNPGQLPPILYCPQYERRVFLKAFDGTLSGGGNTTDDRLSEFGTAVQNYLTSSRRT